MVTKNDIINTAKELGIEQGDIVLIHSSFKSLGEVENGAQTVVEGFLEAVGEDGTLVFPTLCQKDWLNVYKNWHMDAPSDVGYLTNYFRKLPGAKRSNQATHSVAAMGKDADYLTCTHGESGLRHGLFGSTPFSADSPWEKMYHKNAKIVFIGADVHTCTFCHYVEYCFVDGLLKKLESSQRYDELKSLLRSYEEWEKRGAWPYTSSRYVCSFLEKEGKIKTANCGNAGLLCFGSKDYVEKSGDILEKEDWNILDARVEEFTNWYDEVQSTLQTCSEMI